jgi:hypothetical protein
VTGPRKLVLVVIDAMVPAMLERAVAEGQAPALERILAEGTWVPECVSPFPSVTPVCAATITTGVGPDRHGIPAMNWYHRGEQRYVEYGSSFTASRRHGVVRSLTDTVYRMNGEHLSSDVRTVYERLDDDAVRTAGTTYLIYRGRFEHQASEETTLARVTTSTVFGGRSVMGPRELFYADLYASRRTGCRSQMGLPGVRDQHTGCVGAYLEEHDLYDFMLFSLPDNDAWSHRNGPEATVSSIAAADRQLMRLMDAGGGPDAFLADHAVVVVSDHAQVTIDAAIPLREAFRDFAVATPRRLRDNVREGVRDVREGIVDGVREVREAGVRDARWSERAGADWEGTVARWRDMPRASEGEIAISPSMRSAQIYVLDGDRREELVGRCVAVLSGLPGVDLVMWMHGDEAVIKQVGGGELRFAPGSQVADQRDGRWDVEGALSVLGGELEDGVLVTREYPDALARVWSALHCEHAGDVLASAGPGHEFVDAGGQHHIGGGSHGSLHRSDSFAALAFCGLDPAVTRARADTTLWALKDVTPMVCEHFSGQAGVRGELAPR